MWSDAGGAQALGVEFLGSNSIRSRAAKIDLGEGNEVRGWPRAKHKSVRWEANHWSPVARPWSGLNGLEDRFRRHRAE